MIRKIISASLSPNTDIHDISTALRVLISPWTWNAGTSEIEVRHWFREVFHADAYLFTSGRVALYELLKAFGIGTGDEVILQAFTCVAVPNSVRWAGAMPVYADIDKSLNIDPTDFEKKITRKTKAVIVQHTFGNAADMDAIAKIAHKQNILVIEDCAHALGATYKGKMLGTLGDAAFFSFGRDKAVSSVWGGAACIHKSNHANEAADTLAENHHRLPKPSAFWILQQLLHPLAFSVILPTYRSGMGKALLVTLQKIHALSKPVFACELDGNEPPHFRMQYPNALAQLLIVQLKKLPDMVKTRRENERLYRTSYPKSAEDVHIRNGASLLRYPLIVSDPEMYMKQARAAGILLGNWYHHVIDPFGTNFTVISYNIGGAPVAEHIAKHIINLPTLLSKREVTYVIDTVA